jgi:hypothetical protein
LWPIYFKQVLLSVHFWVGEMAPSRIAKKSRQMERAIGELSYDVQYGGKHLLSMLVEARTGARARASPIMLSKCSPS